MSRLRVLVACEESGTVRDAFAYRGHDAWSCDILPSRTPGNHIQGTILDAKIVSQKWDLMIAHPDCTFLTVSGARWMDEPWRKEAQMSALHFVLALWEFPVQRIAIENPIGKLSTMWMKPSQIIQPYWFGDKALKSTCLWLKNLPPLIRTHTMEPPPESDPERKEWEQVWREPPGPNRKRNRSTTFQGLARTMADQWGNP